MMTSSRFCFHAVTLALTALACLGVMPARAGLLVISSTDESTGQVLRYDERTGAFIDVFIDTFSGGPRGSYGGMVIGPDGNLYVSKTIGMVGQPGEVQRHDVTTGAFLDNFVPRGSGGLTRPNALHFGPDGNLYLRSTVPAGVPDDSILRYNGTTGTFLDVFVPPTGNPSTGEKFNDFVFGPDSNLYIAAGGDVLRYDRTTGAFLGLFAGGIGGNFTGLVFGPDGNLYVSATFYGSFSGPVERFDGVTGAFIDVFAGPGGGPFLPGDLIFGPDGNLYVSSTDTDSVKRYDGRTGAFLGDFVLPGSGGLVNPTDLLFTPSAVIPEPGKTLTLLSAGLLGLIGYSLWRRGPLKTYLAR